MVTCTGETTTDWCAPCGGVGVVGGYVQGRGGGYFRVKVSYLTNWNLALVQSRKRQRYLSFVGLMVSN